MSYKRHIASAVELFLLKLLVALQLSRAISPYNQPGDPLITQRVTIANTETC